jgi:hypothetical protein
MSWRDGCRPIIARVLADNPGLPEKELRKKLLEAYPFGPRKYHPYKIWCDEINVQLGKKKVKERKGVPVAAIVPCAGQQEMFSGDNP